MEQSCGIRKNELLSVRCVRYPHCNTGTTGAPGATAAGTIDHWAAAWAQHLAPLGVTRSHRFEVVDVHSFFPQKDLYIYIYICMYVYLYIYIYIYAHSQKKEQFRSALGPPAVE